jgi:kynurenine 3-monooxygenase
MRDHVASRVFLIRKSTEKLLHRIFPERFVPLYSMVTFSRVPYGDAVARARRQWRSVRRYVGAIGGIVLILLLFALWRLL